MRTNEEIVALVRRLEKHNAIIDKQLLRCDSDGDSSEETFDGLAVAFNSNSTMLCALRWVLGEETITTEERAG